MLASLLALALQSAAQPPAPPRADSAPSSCARRLITYEVVDRDGRVRATLQAHDAREAEALRRAAYPQHRLRSKDR